MKKLITVVSDVHLGYEGSNKEEFESFLDSRGPRQDVEQHMVLLGDLVDMWRRDASGIFLENRLTLEKVLDLRNKGFHLHYVVGNHDHHLLYLKGYSYPLVFKPYVVIEDPPHSYLFLHGHEFDDQQNKYVMEILCRFMSDELGRIQSEMWGKLLSLRYRLSTWGILGLANRKIKDIKAIPESRLSKEQLQEIESKAYDRVRGNPNTILVFGHTHRPFIVDNEHENLVNSGSWVSDSMESEMNTYVELLEGTPRLYQWGKGEISIRRAVL